MPEPAHLPSASGWPPPPAAGAAREGSPTSVTALADMAPAGTALAGAAPARSATTVTTAGAHRAHPAAAAEPADATPAHAAPAHAAPAAPAADGGPHPSGDPAPAPVSPLDTLRHLVAQVLGMPADAVRPGHGFTELGGDSIQAIQVVSRARAAGLLVTTRDVLRSESVSALATAARAADGPPASEGPSQPPRRTGPLAATPIMAWLGELAGPVDTYHQSLVVRTPAGFRAEHAVRLVRALLDTHDVLRLTVPGGAGTAAAGCSVPPPGDLDAHTLVEHVRAPDADDAELPALTTDRIRAARRLLSPADGVMLRAVLVDRGPGRQGRLALVVHHLVVDGVSWRILQDDLRTCWARLAAGEDPVLEPAPTPFAHWADLLRADATSGRRMREAARWTDTLRAAPEPLGGVCPSTRLDPETPDHRLTLTLPPDVAGPLLTVVPGVVNGTVNDVLLTGLALAVLAWRRPLTGPQDGGTVLVDVEGHGREDVAGAPDLSRTVGWFTTVYPVRFDLGRPDLDDARAGGPAAGAVLRTVKETLRAVPDHGIGHGLLRHGNSRTGPALAALGVPEIGFNYLGRFPMGDTADWAAAPGHDFALDEADDGLAMAHAVEVNAAAHEGPDGPTLSATWTWAGNACPADRAHALAHEWFAMLRALVRHAALPGAAGLTPSDVSLPGLGQAELDAFEAQFGELL
ncbi:condensation domain-containing protein [Streptomyces sp. NPDC102395]|uniref:condensation domain-containing protein n=1 Tax=Streptomyces sp. NPDC102395 TaxID=3366168 RepID=UPI003824C1F0